MRRIVDQLFWWPFAGSHPKMFFQFISQFIFMSQFCSQIVLQNWFFPRVWDLKGMMLPRWVDFSQMWTVHTDSINIQMLNFQKTHSVSVMWDKHTQFSFWFCFWWWWWQNSLLNIEMVVPSSLRDPSGTKRPSYNTSQWTQRSLNVHWCNEVTKQSDSTQIFYISMKIYLTSITNKWWS